MLQRLGLEKRRIDACKNHCILFDGEYKYLTSCVVCNEPRYKSGTIPNLVLTYLSIVPRFQRLFMSKKTAKEMTWHSYHQTGSGKMVWYIQVMVRLGSILTRLIHYLQKRFEIFVLGYVQMVLAQITQVPILIHYGPSFLQFITYLLGWVWKTRTFNSRWSFLGKEPRSI